MDLVKPIEGGITVLQNVTIAMLVTATSCVGLRIYARAFMMRTFSIDDYAMIACWLCFASTTGVTFAFVREIKQIFENGVIASNITTLLKLDTALYILTMLTLKISLGYWFLGIFARQKKQRIAIHINIWTNVVYGLVYFILSVATCGLLNSFSPTKVDCNIQDDYNGISNSWSVLNAFTDVVFAGFSIIALWNAQMPRSTKAVAYCLLLLGCLGGVASIIRLVELNLPDAGIAGGLRSGYWSIIEAGVGISAASLATLRPLFRLFFESVKKTVAGTTKNSNTHNSIRGHPLNSALVKGSRIATTHDWRDDRLAEPNDMEKGKSNTTFVTTIASGPMSDKSSV